MYEKMLQYVKEMLSKYDSSGGIAKNKINYNRFMHTKRVLKFANRIYNELSESEKQNIDYESLVIATIFHDSGYGQIERKEHAIVSERICRDYLNDIKYDSNKIDFICYMIQNHSNKELLTDVNTPLEMILLLEADLFDDTGAQGIVMDIWIEALDKDASFESILEHIKRFSLSDIQENPMRTKPAKRLWESKRKLTEEFVRQYETDLEV